LRNYSEPLLIGTGSSGSFQHSHSTLGRSAPSPFRLSALDQTGASAATQQRAKSGGNNTPQQQLQQSISVSSLENPELRRIWQNVLRECHRVDPDRTGQINRNTFLTALERADNGKTMTAEAMSVLAEKYTLSNGLINYLLLFRNFLQDLTSTNPNGNNHHNEMLKLTLPVDGDTGKIHPWEFGYERKHHQQKNPYWEKATTMPVKDGLSTKQLIANLSLSSFPPPLTDKDGQQYSTQDKALLLAKYDPSVIDVCKRCFSRFAAVWRPLRNDFKKEQVPTQKGNILATHFISVLEKHGIALSKRELGLIIRNFRGQGMEDLVKFDDFLRICMLTKE
jgi:Ca2+-binding EF-hand superfamily protein